MARVQAHFGEGLFGDTEGSPLHTPIDKTPFYKAVSAYVGKRFEELPEPERTSLEEQLLGEVGGIFGIDGVRWDRFEELRDGEEKTGFYTITPIIYDQFEENGTLNVERGWGVFDGFGLNIGPKRTLFPYFFNSKPEAERYRQQVWGGALFPTEVRYLSGAKVRKSPRF
ncbi:MAG: hypothetical protein JW727_03795 [Candidatus Aenigmarchaeota archaeon]|nr:hypothetical protein [Candidatus Aenigmarchaeota archaeon]